MDMGELEARILAMEDEGARRAMADEQRGFMDKYGTMFSGDEGIGMAILGEMTRRGVPSAAVGADRVVQEILDDIRQEATVVLDKIKSDRDTVNALIDQVQDIQESVAAATGGEPGDGVLDMPPEGTPPMDAGALPPDAGLPPPDMGAPPADLGAAGPDLGAGAPPPEVPGPGMPMAGEMPPPEAIPPVNPPSDSRVKRILTVKPLAPKPASGWKPPAHLLNAVGSKV